MLRKGHQIKAKLIEEVEKNYWIVSFQGNLIQVKNSTNIAFSAGRILYLEVTNPNPLELKVLEKSHPRNLRIDFRV